MLSSLFKKALPIVLLAWIYPLSAEDFVGDALCSACHSQAAESFQSTHHAKTMAAAGKEAICETCHGNGTRHVKTMNPDHIRNPIRLPADQPVAACTACHADRGQRHWPKAMGEDTNCTKCHAVHDE